MFYLLHFSTIVRFKNVKMQGNMPDKKIDKCTNKTMMKTNPCKEK